MTDISNNYPVRLHTDSSVPANSTQRLSIHRWKERTVKNADGSETKIAALPARSVSVPKLSLSVIPDCLSVALTDALSSLQDQLIKSLIEASIEAGNTDTVLTDSQIDDAAIAEYAREQATSGRLSSKAIELWYNSSLQDSLALALANALSINEQSPASDLDKLNEMLATHKKLIVDLASPRAMMNQQTATQLIKAVRLATTGSNSAVKQQLLDKLEAFRAPKEVLTLSDIL